MPAIQTTVISYLSTTPTQTQMTACIAAAFAAITATNSNITLYQNASNAGTNYLVYACSNPIGSGTYNTVYMVILIPASGAIITIGLYETWNTSTFTGTNGNTNGIANANYSNFTSLAYTTYTDNSSYGIVSIYRSDFSTILTLGYIATVSNNTFQSENIMPSIMVFGVGGTSALFFMPTLRFTTSAGGAVFVPSFGTQGTNFYNGNPVINYPIGFNGIGSCSNDLGFTTYSFNFRDTVTIGSQVWVKINITGNNFGLFVRTA
jgi:hypothetical protein